VKKKYIFSTLFILLIVGLGIFVWLEIHKQTQTSLLKQPKSAFPLTLKWTKALDGSGYGSPIYQDGLVFFSTNNLGFTSSWHGLEAITGDLVWSQQVEGRSSSLDCLTSTYLVIHGFEGFLSLNPKSGEIVWRGEDDRWDTTCSNELVVAVVPRGTLKAFDISTGELRWRTSLSDANFYSIIYQGMVHELLGVANGTFYIIDPDTGKILRSLDNELPFGLTDSSTIIDGQLFSEGGVMDTRTGELTRLEISSGFPPALLHHRIYFSAFDKGVVALDRETFQEEWTYLPSSPIQAKNAILVTLTKVAVLDNIGYVILSDATLRAFDLETGQELGYWQPDDEILSNWPSGCLGNPRIGPNRCTAGVLAGLTVAEDILIVSFGGDKLYALGKP
jgi:outer membrane protein assembly factor BamB